MFEFKTYENNEAMFIIKINEIQILKKMKIFNVFKEGITFYETGEKLTIKTVQFFIDCIKQNKNCEIIFDDYTFDSVKYENKIIKFIFKTAFQFEIEINETNNNEILYMFNSFLNWCENLIMEKEKINDCINKNYS